LFKFASVTVARRRLTTMLDGGWRLC